jgi:hypothetical protein
LGDPPAGRPPLFHRWLVLALVVPLAGAAPAPAASAPWLPPAVDVALAEGSLYAMSEPDQDWVLTRYELPDGAVRWATRLGHDGPASVELAGTVPVVATAAAGEELTTGYDPDTGRPRWRHPGWPSRAIEGAVVLHRGSTLVAVDLETGAVTWTIPIEGSELQMYGWPGRASGYPTQLVLLSGNRLTRYDLATGAVAAAIDLPGGRSYYPADGGGVPAALFAQLWGSVFARELAHPAVAGGVVMLTEPARGGEAVAAYDVATLAPRWRLPGYGWAASCGPVVCAVASDLSRLAGVDPETGAVRWFWTCRAHGSFATPAASAAWPQYAPAQDELVPVSSQSCYVLPSALGPADPMLVQQWQLGPGGVDTAWLVDPNTGATVAELGQWRALGRIDATSWLLRWADEDEPIYGNRNPERIWLGRLTLDPARVAVLDWIESPAVPELVWLHARAGGGGRA